MQIYTFECDHCGSRIESKEDSWPETKLPMGYSLGQLCPECRDKIREAIQCGQTAVNRSLFQRGFTREGESMAHLFLC